MPEGGRNIHLDETRNQKSPTVKDETAKNFSLDELDIRILDLLLMNEKTSEIAKSLGHPLSTVQRRVRKLFEANAITNRNELNYRLLGLKRGEIHVYLRTGDARAIAQQLTEMEGMMSVAVHIGNSDIVGFFMYQDSGSLLELTSKIRRIEGVDRVLWSEEVFSLPIDKKHALSQTLGSKV